MAFILTAPFAPAYQAPQCSPFGFCAPVSQSTYPYRVSRPQPRRPAYSSFNHFFSQVDELLSEIDRKAQRQAQIAAHIEAQREAYHQRQQRKRALRAKFAVSQNEQGWQIDGDTQGFDQENISIEVTDEHTLKIAGNTEWQSEKALPETQLPGTEATAEVDGATLTELIGETATETEATTAGTDSDNESHKSYQPTVEDDFEDLGAETSSLISVSSASSTAAEPKEPKGKEKVVEEPAATHSEVVQEPQSQPQLATQPQQPEQSQEQERVHGSFERTFRFPERIDADNVSASFKDGGLKITVPRAQVPQTRRIAIL